MTMAHGLCKFALTGHVASWVSWLSAVASFLALAFVGLTNQDVQVVHAPLRPRGQRARRRPDQDLHCPKGGGHGEQLGKTCVGLRGGEGLAEDGRSYRRVRSDGQGAPNKPMKLTVAFGARSLSAGR